MTLADLVACDTRTDMHDLLDREVRVDVERVATVLVQVLRIAGTLDHDVIALPAARPTDDTESTVETRHEQLGTDDLAGPQNVPWNLHPATAVPTVTVAAGELVEVEVQTEPVTEVAEQPQGELGLVAGLPVGIERRLTRTEHELGIRLVTPRVETALERLDGTLRFTTSTHDAVDGDGKTGGLVVTPLAKQVLDVLDLSRV